MKTTTSKDLVKVNQILLIMQAHFGKSMNLARIKLSIKLMAYLLHALCIVQTVSLHKLADAMPTYVEKDSNLRRLQRFHKDMNIKPIGILKHGGKAKSLVKYGLEEIATILMRPTYKPKFDVFKFLSCTQRVFEIKPN